MILAASTHGNSCSASHTIPDKSITLHQPLLYISELQYENEEGSQPTLLYINSSVSVVISTKPDCHQSSFAHGEFRSNSNRFHRREKNCGCIFPRIQSCILFK